MAKIQDRQAQAMQYLQLIRSGVPPADAFQQAYPNGIPTQAQQDKQASKDKQNSNLAATGGTIGGLLAAKYGTEYIPQIWGGGTTPSTTPTPTTGTPTAPAAPYGVGTSANGTTMMSDGSTSGIETPTGLSGRPLAKGETPNPDGTVTDGSGATVGQWVQGVGGAMQVVGGYNQIKDGETLGGAGNIYAGGANMYGAYTGGGTYGAGTVAAAANVGQQMLNKKGNSEDRAAKAQAEAAKAALLYIPVYGQAIYAALYGIDAVSDGAATKQITKSMKAGNQFSDHFDMGAGKSIRSKVFHQDTRGAAADKSSQLYQLWNGTKSSDGKTDQIPADDKANAYLQGYREPYNTAPVGKAFHAGDYATFDEYREAGLDPKDLVGVYGNLKTFGPQWAHLSEDQRQSVTQGIIGADLYRSKKGDVYITDPDKAKEIYSTILGPSQPQNQMSYGVPAAAQTPQAPTKFQPVGNQMLQSLNTSNKKK